MTGLKASFGRRSRATPPSTVTATIAVIVFKTGAWSLTSPSTRSVAVVAEKLRRRSAPSVLQVTLTGPPWWYVPADQKEGTSTADVPQPEPAPVFSRKYPLSVWNAAYCRPAAPWWIWRMLPFIAACHRLTIGDGVTGGGAGAGAG